GLCFLSAVSCRSTQRHTGETDLATIEVELLSASDLSKVYGEKCEKLKLNKQNATVAKVMSTLQEHCSIIATLISYYSLDVTPSDCVNGTAFKNKVGQATSAIGEVLQRGCNYSIKVSLGYDGSYFLSNEGYEQKNLLKDALNADPVKLKI